MAFVKSRFFEAKEFDSPDRPGSGSLMSESFVDRLDTCRAECGFPFRVTSGYRTEAHNEDVGGKSASAHTRGMAVDIAVMTSLQRFRLIDSALRNGIRRIGVGSNFVHLDVDSSLPQGVIWTY